MTARYEEALKNRNIPFRRDVKTATLCTFRIGGRCRLLVEPQCVGELIDAVLLARQAGAPYEIIGRGSNLLFGDDDIPLAIIRTTALNGVRFENGTLIADCGAFLPRLARMEAARGFADLAFACGIPASLGGGVCMNAGAHGGALEECVKWAKILFAQSGEIRTLFNKELSYSYRNSIIKLENAIVLQAGLALRKCRPSAEILAEMRELLARRSATQPVDMPSAGSVFLRTESGVSMGQIIDELGLKGLRCGNAAVSEKHAGFIVNLGGATARDVHALIKEITKTVKEKRGFEPIAEIRFIPKGERA